MIDLGRQHHALWLTASNHDEQRTQAAKHTSAYASADAAHEAAVGQAYGVQSFMFTRPIATLADATALAVLGHSLAEGCDDRRAEIGGNSEDIALMRRAFARFAVLLSQQSGVSLHGLGGPLSETCITRDAMSGEITQ